MSHNRDLDGKDVSSSGKGQSFFYQIHLYFLSHSHSSSTLLFTVITLFISLFHYNSSCHTEYCYNW